VKAAICPKVYRNIIILIIFLTSFSLFFAKADDLTTKNNSGDALIAEHVLGNNKSGAAFTGCPGTQTRTISSGCSTSVIWVPPVSSDPLSTVESTHIPGDIFEVGKTTVTYTEKNNSGVVTDICSFIVNVKLTSGYALSNCPSDISIKVTEECNRSVGWVEPTVPCGITLSSTHQPGDFPIGTTTVIYTAGKDGDIYAFCSFDITVRDTISPVFDFCPTNITTDANNNCAAVATWTLPTASDNCGFEPTLTSNFDSGDTFPLGTTTVTYTATDEGGNTATCSFDVIVEDNTGPEFLNLPGEVRVSADESCGASVLWDEVLVEDNCSPNIDIIINSDAISGDRFNLGQSLVTYSATDIAGNETIASFNVIVEDNTAPINTSCPTNITISADNNCEATATWDVPTFADNCDSSPQVSSSHNSGDTFPFGDTEVSYTATDNFGNETVCSFIVTVIDEIDPVIISQPDNLIVSAQADACEAIIIWDDVVAEDNCSSSVDVVTDFNSGDTFPLGETLVEITATDDSGNQKTSSFTVTVEDNTVPSVVSCPADITITTTDNCDAIANWTAPTFSDTCDANPVVTSTHNSGDVFPLGTTIVTYTATDSSGNINTCSFNVMVEDDVAPEFTSCVTDVVVTANAQCQAVAEWTAPTVTDNCSEIITLTSDFNSGDAFPLGTTVVTYTATDQAGNSATCTFNVIVEDNTAPEIISELSDLVVSSSQEGCQAIVTWNDIVAVDNCSDEVKITSNFNSGDIFLIGESNVEITATDAAGNKTTASFTVTVEDNTAPVTVSCPSDVRVSAKGNCESIGQWDVPEFSDNCDTDLTVTSSHAPNDKFPLGSTVVTYTATDAAGNSRSCSFNVIVEDDSAPVFTTCISDIIITSDDQCEAVAEWTTPQVTDNCDTSITLESDFLSGDRFPLGSTTVTYTATDDAGNSTSCSFDVLVEDNSSPALISCPDKLTLGTNANCRAIAEWEEPVFEDCSDFSISSNFQLGDELPLGISVIEYTATDANGETSFCSFEVEVIDQTAPVVEFCPQDINVTASDNCEAIVEWNIPTAIDNCSTVSSNANYESGDSFPIGSTTVEYEFIDETGNKSSCSFNVTVIDESGILVENCPEDVTLKAENNNGTAIVTWEEPTASAACSEVTVSSSHLSGSIFEVGSTTVTYTFTTDSNQSFSCSFEVVVEPIVLEIEFNKLITPNGDGDNDEWIIQGIEQFPDNQVIVVDRWGAEIFSATGYNNDEVVWRGENKNGEIVPRGTYYYFISVRNEQDAIDRKGFLEILR